MREMAGGEGRGEGQRRGQGEHRAARWTEPIPERGCLGRQGLPRLDQGFADQLGKVAPLLAGHLHHSMELTSPASPRLV